MLCTLSTVTAGIAFATEHGMTHYATSDGARRVAKDLANLTRNRAFVIRLGPFDYVVTDSPDLPEVSEDVYIVAEISK